METSKLLFSIAVVAFAALLPCDFAASQQATTPEGQQPAPTTQQQTDQDAEGVLAVITQSRSTNTRGYKVMIHNDGSATAEIEGASFAGRIEPPRSQQFPAGTIDTKTLRRLLTEIGDVSSIPIGACAKSVSFGTRTQITYEGKTSGDLQCIRRQSPDGQQVSPPAAEELGRFVQTTLAQLKINDRRLVIISQ
jgi:hypothetical protein